MLNISYIYNVRYSVDCALPFRPTKGDDDSDDEEGGSRPKKQRKPKERKRIEKVFLSFLCSVLMS